MLRLALLLTLIGSTAYAQTATYLVEPSLAACLTRSQTQCTKVGCDGKQTIYWWDCEPLQSGQAVLIIQPGDPQFDATTKVGPSAIPKSQGLSTAEQSQLTPNLPSPLVTGTVAVGQ